MKKIEKQYRNKETIQKQRNNIEIEKQYRNRETIQKQRNNIKIERKKRLMVPSEVTITTALYLRNR